MKRSLVIVVGVGVLVGLALSGLWLLGNEKPSNAAIAGSTAPFVLPVESLRSGNSAKDRPPISDQDGVRATLKSKANHLYAMLMYGETPATCTPEVQAELGDLLSEAYRYENLWLWTLERAIACRRALSQHKEIALMLQDALKARGHNARILELLAEQNLLTGNAAQAIKPASDAARLGNSYDAWELLASANLALADQLRNEGGEPTQIRNLYQAAFDAASRSADLASVAMQPFQHLKMANAQLGLGNSLEALDNATRAEFGMQQASSRSQAALVPYFYMQLGAFYYRAGRKDIGIAYMDQALGMAGPNAEKLTAMRNSVLASEI
jgi:hypothetical protein